MGYTHYCYRPQEFDLPTWRKYVEDCRRILDGLPDRTNTAGGYYGTEPLAIAQGEDLELSDDAVMFEGSGKAEHGEELCCENFVVERVFQREPYSVESDPGSGLWHQFTKTARYPYDVAVVACLCALKARFPQVLLRSDGDTAELAEGYNLWRRTMPDEVYKELGGFLKIPAINRCFPKDRAKAPA
jgi:hypothetical protein